MDSSPPDERTSNLTDLSFTLPRALRFVAPLVVALALVACGGGDDNGDPTGPADPGRTATVEGGSVDVTADDIAFDVDTIEAPAGEAFTIVFTNAEGVPHNIAIHTEQGGEDVMMGDVITGPDATIEYEVPALEPGEYYFECTVHPNMNGTIVVEG